jgi:hypothetical protein
LSGSFNDWASQDESHFVACSLFQMVKVSAIILNRSPLWLTLFIEKMMRSYFDSMFD